MVDRQECAAVCPAEHQQSVTFLEALGDMVKNTGSQFCPLAARTLIERIIDDETVVAIFRSQRPQMLSDDTRRQQRREAAPVCAGICKEAIIGVFAERAGLSKCLLHVEAAVPEHIGQDVDKQFGGRKSLFLAPATSHEQADNTVCGNELGDSTGNNLFIC